MFWTYYTVCFIYCIVMSFKKWNREVQAGGLGITPGLDTLGIIIMAPILAPVDIALTWIRIYREAEEARRNQTKL
jgi:hypothetical protein